MCGHMRMICQSIAILSVWLRVLLMANSVLSFWFCLPSRESLLLTSRTPQVWQLETSSNGAFNGHVWLPSGRSVWYCYIPPFAAKINSLEALTRFVAIFHARQGLTVNFPWRFQGSWTVVGASVVVLVRLHYSSITGIDITCNRCRHHWHHYKASGCSSFWIHHVTS